MMISSVEESFWFVQPQGHQCEEREREGESNSHYNIIETHDIHPWISKHVYTHACVFVWHIMPKSDTL